MSQRSKRAGLVLIAVGLAVLLVVPSATGRQFTITGKLHSLDREFVDQDSKISMTVIVRNGKPRKLKNVSVTYSYDCDGYEGAEGVATASFARTIDINWKPGFGLQDSPDFDHREKIPDGPDPGTIRDGERSIEGQVTRRGRRAAGQIWLTFDNYMCGSMLGFFSAPLAEGPPRKSPR